MTGLLDIDSSDARLGAPSLAALVRAVTAAAGSAGASDALRALAEAAQAVSGAEIVVVRTLDEGGDRLEMVAVAGPRALAAEFYGTVLLAAELPEAPLDDLARAPAAVRRIGARRSNRPWPSTLSWTFPAVGRRPRAPVTLRTL